MLPGSVTIVLSPVTSPNHRLLCALSWNQKFHLSRKPTAGTHRIIREGARASGISKSTVHRLFQAFALQSLTSRNSSIRTSKKNESGDPIPNHNCVRFAKYQQNTRSRASTYKETNYRKNAGCGL
jgi:hypothetical protein